MNQSHLLQDILDFDDRSRPKTAEGKNKRNSYERAYALYEGRKLIVNAFRSGNFEFPIKKQGKNKTRASKISNSSFTSKSR